MPWLISSSLASPMILRKSHTHYISTGNTVNHSLLKMDLCSVKKLSSFLHQKGRWCLVLCTNHTKSITKTQLLANGCVFWPGINKGIEEAVQQCETFMRFQAQNTAAPLTPTSTHSLPWQICASDIFTLDGVDYLILADFHTKVILVCQPPCRPKSSISWRNGFVIMAHHESYTQILAHFANAACADCSIEWSFTHETLQSTLPTVQWIC